MTWKTNTAKAVQTLLKLTSMKQQMREENECPLKKYKVCVIVIERLVNKFENVSLNNVLTLFSIYLCILPKRIKPKFDLLNFLIKTQSHVVRLGQVL